MLDFSARNHQTNEHITLRLESVIPRVLEYFEESGLEPLIVDGCVVIYKGTDGHWWIQTVDGQPDIRIPGRYGTAEELYGLNNQQRAALRGDDRPSREDDNETMRQQEEDGEQERVDKAKAKVANSHMDRDKYKPFIDGILHNGPLLPGQGSEHVLSVAYLVSDPTRGVSLLPTLFGVAGTSQTPSSTAFEEKRPCPRRANEGEDSRVERRLRNAARYCTNRNTIGHLRLSDTFRQMQVEAKRNTRAARRGVDD
ncbi:unnamed protein product [Vitrella brassicaformis CCMP3155]|uniref:Uncharacterized protein n=1 Tax=Vitrella brassicaformis (strain CCMP3155) TaxID=1169540 RepID=A0A0G4EG23_VITBC|nr:unnamed protein product [Vitrella brassicaformis CCMP3155]|eukprot:CEL94657.1 unnamed protein product [Vitrella brassicaformis CCMP3155]